MEPWRRGVRCVVGLALLFAGLRERGHRMLALAYEPSATIEMKSVSIPAQHWYCITKSKWLCMGGMN